MKYLLCVFKACNTLRSGQKKRVTSRLYPLDLEYISFYIKSIGKEYLILKETLNMDLNAHNTDFELINDKIPDLLRNKFNIKNVILFGSRASYVQDKDSDIDLVIILGEKGFFKSYREKINRSLEIYEFLQKALNFQAIDLKLFTSDEWEKLKEINSSFTRKICNMGINLV